MPEFEHCKISRNDIHRKESYQYIFPLVMLLHSSNLYQCKMNFQLCNSFSYTTSNAITEGDGTEIVYSVQIIFPQPALRSEFICHGEILFAVGSSIMTECQLRLRKSITLVFIWLKYT